MQELEPLANFAQHACRDQRLALGQLEFLEQLERLADRQVDVPGDTASLDVNRKALGLEPLTFACRALTECAIWFEVLLHGPGAFFIATPQIRDDTFETLAERVCF